MRIIFYFSRDFIFTARDFLQTAREFFFTARDFFFGAPLVGKTKKNRKKDVELGRSTYIYTTSTYHFSLNDSEKERLVQKCRRKIPKTLSRARAHGKIEERGSANEIFSVGRINNPDLFGFFPEKYYLRSRITN